MNIIPLTKTLHLYKDATFYGTVIIKDIYGVRYLLSENEQVTFYTIKADDNNASPQVLFTLTSDDEYTGKYPFKLTTDMTSELDGDYYYYAYIRFADGDEALIVPKAPLKVRIPDGVMSYGDNKNTVYAQVPRVSMEDSNYYVDEDDVTHSEIPLGLFPDQAYAGTNRRLTDEAARLEGMINEVDGTLDSEIGRIEAVISDTANDLEFGLSQDIAAVGSRIDNIIAHNNDTDGNSELLDIRTGTDGTVYNSAGAAVRGQLEKVNDKLEDIDDSMQYSTVVEHSEIKNGYYCAGAYADQSGYRSKVYDVTSLRNRTVYVDTYVYTQYLAVISFYNSEMTMISEVSAPEQKYYTNQPAVVPDNAVYATITTKIGTINGVHYSADSIHMKVKSYVDVNELKQDVIDLEQSASALRQDVNALAPSLNLNHWYGKKVVWLGTSVSFGSNAAKSYAKEAADALGFELVNASVPGQAIHTTANGGIVGNGSTCLSIEEYQDLGVAIADSPVAYTPGGNYNNYYRTYEHIFSQENADADLWVFDVFPNNTDFSTTDWSAFDRGQWKYSDNSAFSDHRSTFYGALLFLLDKLYQLNPEARVVFVIGSTFKISDARTITETLRSTALHYQTIDLWDRINSNVKTNTYLYSLGGTDMHPSAKAHELMGRILIGELLSIA